MKAAREGQQSFMNKHTSASEACDFHFNVNTDLFHIGVHIFCSSAQQPGVCRNKRSSAEFILISMDSAQPTNQHRRGFLSLILAALGIRILPHTPKSSA